MFKVRTKSSGGEPLDRAFSYALTGMSRVVTLVDIYRATRQSLKRPRGRTQVHIADVLRAAVVLCHAQLEEILRQLIVHRGARTPEFLQRVPLVCSGAARAEKFTLADLMAYSTTTVGQLIEISISAHISSKSFSSVDDIVAALVQCGHKPASYREYLPTISEMIKRRHHIAHTGDASPSTGRGIQASKSISVSQVQKWGRSTTAFIVAIMMNEDMKRHRTMQSSVPLTRVTPAAYAPGAPQVAVR